MGSLWERGVTRYDFMYIVKRSLRLLYAAEIVGDMGSVGVGKQRGQ